MSFFDSISKQWDTDQRIQLAQDNYQSIIKAIPLNLQMDALEIGAGTGLLTIPLSKKVHQILALDTSTGMLEVLQKKIEQTQSTNIQIINSKLENIKDKKFDFIYSAMTFHHIENIQDAIRQLSVLCKQDGFVAIADLVEEDGNFHDSSHGVFHQGFNLEILKNIFEKQGFSNIQTQISSQIIKKQNKKYPVFLLTAQKN